MKKLTSYMLLLICGIPGIVLAESAVSPDVGSAVVLDLNHSSRSEADRARDRNRLPQETLAFFGLKDDMRVIELFPGAGWYTKLLGPYLEKKGKLYVAIGTDRVEKKFDEFGLSKVQPTGIVENFSKTEAPGYIFTIDRLDLQQTDIDLIVTFRNAHNLTNETRALLNNAVFAALKPGGVYGIIDHTKRHMEAFSEATWRRTDPVQIIKEAVSAGFEFVDYLDIHSRPEDELKFDTKHESLVNETDRYTLKFRKPL